MKSGFGVETPSFFSMIAHVMSSESGSHACWISLDDLRPPLPAPWLIPTLNPTHKHNRGHLREGMRKKEECCASREAKKKGKGKRESSSRLSKVAAVSAVLQTLFVISGCYIDSLTHPPTEIPLLTATSAVFPRKNRLQGGWEEAIARKNTKLT
jgi:hypothetical protein